MTGRPRELEPPRTVAATQRPAAMLFGPGHVIVHANEAFVGEFGGGCVGLPAAEALIDLPSTAFALLDLAFREGRALACPITVRGTVRRLVVAPGRDVETGAVYGLRLHLVPKR